MNARQVEALTNPLTGGGEQLEHLRAHRYLHQAGDGVMEMVILEVDR